MHLYRFLSYWLADRTRALILFSSFLVPVSLRVCACVCVGPARCCHLFRENSHDIPRCFGRRVTPAWCTCTCFIDTRTSFSDRPCSQFHRDISFLRELFRVSRTIEIRISKLQVTIMEHGTIASSISWYVVELWWVLISRYRMTSVISPDSQTLLFYKHGKKSKHGRGSTNYFRSSVIALIRMLSA